MSLVRAICIAGPRLTRKCCAGVTGNKALPTWLITMLLLLLLIWLTEKMFVKAFKVHASERERERWAEKKSQEAQEQGAGDDGEHTDKPRLAGDLPSVCPALRSFPPR